MPFLGSLYSSCYSNCSQSSSSSQYTVYPSHWGTMGTSWARTSIHLCSPIKCLSKMMCPAKRKPFGLRKQKNVQVWSFPQLPLIPPDSRNLLLQGSPFLMEVFPCIELTSVSTSLPLLSPIHQDHTIPEDNPLWT